MKTFTQPFASEADGDLAKKVQLYLSANRPGFRQLDIGAKGGTVTLSGSVASFFLRQLAVAATKRVAGVRQLVDDIEVALRGNSTR
jgi:osmotically-inducible protein OsmY